MKGKLLQTLSFFFQYGGLRGYMVKYGNLLRAYGKAWEACDVEGILAFFEDSFVYTDQIRPAGIYTKPELKKYLEELFKLYPRQTWTKNVTVFPTNRAIGHFAVCYDYTVGGNGREFTGTGMEKFVFKGNKLIEERVHFIINELDLNRELGFESQATSSRTMPRYDFKEKARPREITL